MTGVGPFAARLDADLVDRYLAVTDPEATRGGAMPPTMLAMLLWEAQEAARAALVPAAVATNATGGVHGEHDIVVHRPIRVGEELALSAELHGIRPAGRHSAATIRYDAVDARGELAAQQWWTTVYLGVSPEPVGEAAPDHSARSGVAVATADVDTHAELARRYAEVSGDWSAHHFEAEAAQHSGADRPFLHGLCTMALCANRITRLVADGDHGALRRVAVRFAAPTPLGETLHLTVTRDGRRTHGFTAKAAGRPVITNGLVEVR